MATSRVKQDRLRFAGFTLDTTRCVVEADGSVVSLRPKSFDVLRYLVENHGRPVSTSELLDQVWTGAVVTEDSVRQCVNDVRKALGDLDQNIIRTVPRRGYLLDVPVLPAEGDVSDLAERASPKRWSRMRWLLAMAAVVSIVAAGAWLLTRPAGPGEEAGAATPAPKSIAVLRFSDMSPQGDDSHLAEGFSEEILNILAQSPSLQVIARTSAFAVQGGTIWEIADRLGVTHVLEGSIRRNQDQIRITAQLIDTASGAHLWSETYDRELGNFLDVQEEVARAVARALSATLDLADGGRRPDPRAHERFLEGRYFYLRRAPGDLDTARARYEEALAIDAEYAQAWAGLAAIARIRLSLSGSGHVEDPAAREALFELQKYAVEQALEFGPGLVETQYRAAAYFIQVGNLQRAREHWFRALAIDPENWLVQSTLASEYRLSKRIDLTIDLISGAMRRDPLNRILRMNLASLLLEAGRFEDVVAEVGAAGQLLPPAFQEQDNMEFLRIRARILQGALEGILGEVRRMPESADRQQMLALAYAGLEAPANADDALDRLLASANGPEDALRIAEVYGYRGEVDSALEWLRRIGDPPRCEDPVDPSVIYYSPFLARMSGEAAWDEWRSRMGRVMDACRIGVPVEPGTVAPG